MKIYNKILDSKIERFIKEFSYNSKDIFLDKNGDIIQPAEFGRYREMIVKELLQTIIPQRLSVGTGFIISKSGAISTQCDIIIYDKNNCPLIENENKQTFFPIECVVAIGEIKSDITKSKLKKALIKLQKNKKIRDEINKSTDFIFRKKQNISIIDTSFCPEDSLVTFLICNKITDYNKNLEEYVNNVYINFEQHTKHNMILSVQDGTFIYNYNNDDYYAPIFDGIEATSKFYQAHNDNSHIIIFLSLLYKAISDNTIFIPELSEYIKNDTE